MLNYLLRRILLMVPTLLGITIVVFVVMAAAPGGISAQSLVDGMELEPQSRQALEDYYNKLYGLDKPAPVQYARWLNNISPIGFERLPDGSFGNFSLWKGIDLGTSFRYGRPVTDMVAERLPITLLLNLISIPLIYALAIGIGVQAARQRGGRFDVTSNIFLLGLWSVPSMLAGVLFIGFFASEQYWRWFPTGGLMRRETADQTFLPLFASMSDVLIMVLCVVVVTLALVSASVSFSLKVRQAAGLLVGALLGYAMAFNLHGEWFGVLHILLIPALAMLLRFLAGLSNVGLRIAVAGAFGIGFGLTLSRLLGVEMLQGGYLLDR